MNKNIGIIKKLNDDENLIWQANTYYHTLIIKGTKTSLKKPKRKYEEVPLLLGRAKVFLTNQRFLALTIYQLQAKKLEKGEIEFDNIDGDWFEIPITEIKKVEIRCLAYNEFKPIATLEKKGITIIDKDKINATEITYQGDKAKGKTKKYLEKILKTEYFSGLSNDTGKSEDKILLIGNGSEPLISEIEKRIKPEEDSQEKLCPHANEGVVEDPKFCGDCF